MDEDNKKTESSRKTFSHTRIIVIIAIIIAVFVVVFFSYIDPKVIKPMKQYNTAVDLLEKGEYEKAKTIFKSLGDYKDVSTQLDNCEIAHADALAGEGQYYEALKIYEQYPDNPNVTDEKLTSCKEAMYQDAISYYQKGQYDYAKSEFQLINGYSDSSNYILKCDEAKKEKEEEEKKAAEKAEKARKEKEKKDKQKLIGTWYAKEVINYRDEDITSLMSDLSKVYFKFNEDGTGEFQLSDSEYAERMGEKGSFTWRIEDVDGYGDDAIGTWTFKGDTDIIFYYKDHILMYTEKMESTVMDARFFCYK